MNETQGRVGDSKVIEKRNLPYADIYFQNQNTEFSIDSITNVQGGIIALKEDGTLVFANSFAQKIISYQDGVNIIENRLVFEHKQSNEFLISRLQHSFDDAKLKNHYHKLNYQPNLPFEFIAMRPSMKPPFRILITSQRSNLRKNDISPTEILVFVLICDPTNIAKLPANYLKLYYSLTPQEINVAAILIDTLDINQVAMQLKIKLTTANQYVKNILKKVGVKKQVELIQLLMNLSIFEFEGTA